MISPAHPLGLTNWNADGQPTKPCRHYRLFCTAASSQGVTDAPAALYLKFSDGSNLPVVNRAMARLAVAGCLGSADPGGAGGRLDAERFRRIAWISPEASSGSRRSSGACSASPA